jgi:hypothetical protein
MRLARQVVVGVDGDAMVALARLLRRIDVDGGVPVSVYDVLVHAVEQAHDRQGGGDDEPDDSRMDV